MHTLLRHPRLFLSWLIAFFLATVLFGPSVLAQEVDPEDTAAELRLSALAVTMIVSVVIPIVVGLITKYNLPSNVKAIIMLVLNAVNALIVQSLVAEGGAVFSAETLIQFILGVVVSVAMYAGVYKPMNLTSSTPDGKLMPQSGIG